VTEQDWSNKTRARQDVDGNRVNGDRAQFKRVLSISVAKMALVDDDPPRCRGCGRVIPKPRRYAPNVAYCEERCKRRLYGRKAREKARLELAKAKALNSAVPGKVYASSQTREGEVYERIKRGLTTKEWHDWIERRITDVEISALPGIAATPAAVGLARRAAHNNEIKKLKAQAHQPKASHTQMLGPSDEVMQKLLKDDPAAFEKELDRLVQAFVDWRNEFFRVSATQPYYTKAVHRKWIRATLRTIYTGGRQLILSPPRHGKTELLIHFCDWLICRNPNIRILWVGPNGDIAENCLGQVRDILEGHDKLKEAYLPPGQSWEPQRRGAGLWSRSKFTVDNRTEFLKQPTMWSTGVGGKILSLDADFIIVDDPADPDASYTSGGREKIENWFKVKLITRKMMDTGLAMISSRVHPEDLYSEFIESESWEVVIDKAHDVSVCGLGLYDDHSQLAEPEACVLFPEVNPLQYLREQHDVVGDALFEMMYLNQPRPDGTLIFNPELIREKCLDYTRGLGLEGIPGEYKLVAGLDPAARGVQAAFLWAVQLVPGVPGDHRLPPIEKYYMVDLETQKAGGMEGAEAIMRDWHERYGCELWIVEDNAYQKVFFDDPRIRLVAAELGLQIKPTSTGANKHDPEFGVAGTAPLFHEGKVSLPYSALDPEAVRKTDNYIKQLINFTGATNKQGGGRRKPLSDILMASWFPHATAIKKWRREAKPTRVKQLDGGSYPRMQYPEAPTIPWDHTQYRF
jgi:hypothetical protein